MLCVQLTSEHLFSQCANLEGTMNSDMASLRSTEKTLFSPSVTFPGYRKSDSDPTFSWSTLRWIALSYCFPEVWKCPYGIIIHLLRLVDYLLLGFLLGLIDNLLGVLLVLTDHLLGVLGFVDHLLGVNQHWRFTGELDDILETIWTTKTRDLHPN